MIKIEESYDFNSINKKILEANNNIERIIDKLSKDDRGFLSQNILSELRTFVEYIAFKIHLDGQSAVKDYNNNTIKEALNYIKGRSSTKFIEKFHYYLQITTSHYIQNDDSAERLMLKYYKFLILLKEYINVRYSLNILTNITKFPIDLDITFSQYYKEIASVIESVGVNSEAKLDSDKYYIQRIKPFFIGGKVYYEITLSIANDNANKFDRIIAFTKINILDNYSVKLSLSKAEINIFGQKTQINIINNWSVAIRACEIKNFYRIFDINKQNYNAGDKEYYELMIFLTSESYNLLELVDLGDTYYNKIKEMILWKVKSSTIFDALDICRVYLKKKSSGYIILRYLLYCMNNRIIKNQYNIDKCWGLSNLNLKWECLPFETMPFASSLKNHNPELYDLIDSISLDNRDDELLARHVKSNSERQNKLYTPLEELERFGDVQELVDSYNNKLYDGHKPDRSLVIENKNVHIHSYEKDTISIINNLNALTQFSITNYKSSFESFLSTGEYVIDCEEKKQILTNIYENSSVALVYGAAGTGKSTLIKHLSYFYKDASKICLAHTNPAVENLKRNVLNSNRECMTINKFLSNNNAIYECDILVIDECSTVSNSDMRKILEKAKFTILLLVGDIYQIESISFGNWFNIAKTLVSDSSKYELNFTWRSEDESLLNLWELVRHSDDRIDEMLAKKEFSSPIDNTVLTGESDDEIILCLNYDGLYGINNINNYLQNTNKNKSVTLNLSTYKVGDPIIFGDTNRFLPVIYNNLKGQIIDIEDDDRTVWFCIEIDKTINQLEVQFADLELIGQSANNKSIVKIYVNKYRNADEDDDLYSKSIVPFSIAYAVSIHKSQGLEYKSVKIIITNEVDELITHNIFYTAITRAKEKLKIYWTPECQNKIISTIKHVEMSKDSNIIKYKMENNKE
jgi:Viral (Superfamily 1) RNA helicase.